MEWVPVGDLAQWQAQEVWAAPGANGLGPCFELVILPWSHTKGCQTSLKSFLPHSLDRMLDTVSLYSLVNKMQKVYRALELTQDLRPFLRDCVCPHHDHPFWEGNSSLYLPCYPFGRKPPCNWGWKYQLPV